MQKLGMKLVPGVQRVTIKKSKNVRPTARRDTARSGITVAAAPTLLAGAEEAGRRSYSLCGAWHVDPCFWHLLSRRLSRSCSSSPSQTSTRAQPATRT